AYDYSVVDFRKQVDGKHRDRAHFKQGAEFDTLDRMHCYFPLSAREELPIGQLMLKIHLFKDENLKNLLK
ncbi:hypothetical protein CT0861_09523, partial [Colletotrichum tofieldiae]